MPFMIESLYVRAETLGRLLEQHNLMAVTAESCTGGGIASAITDIAGSSAWFQQGYVTYSNDAKSQLLAVDVQLLQSCGAVSSEVVEAMATGALLASNADLALAVSGIAGPGGGSADKPVGTVWFACGFMGDIYTKKVHFSGDRRAVRAAAVREALTLGESYLKQRLNTV